MLKKLLILLFFTTSISLAANNEIDKDVLSDDEIKERIIQESIFNYNGNCPCPYNRASNGSKCGKRSAYSKPGGYSPKCYTSDITDEMIREYRDKLYQAPKVIPK